MRSFSAGSQPQSALRNLLRMLLLPGAIFLSGCAMAGGCNLLALQTYSPEFNWKVARELEAADIDAAWPLAIRDYVRLRDDVKACSGE